MSDDAGPSRCLRPAFEARARYRVAQVWRLRGKEEHARAALRQSVEIDPDFVSGWLDLLWLSPESERSDLVDLAIRALPLDPSLQSWRRRLRQGVQPAANQGAQGRGSILFYTDSPGIYGAGEITHRLLCAFRREGWKVTCAQPWAGDPRVGERARLGIGHRWLVADDLYAASAPLAFSNHEEAGRVFAEVEPDLVFFCDGCPASNLAAKEAARDGRLPSMAVVHFVSASPSPAHKGVHSRIQDLYQYFLSKLVTISKFSADALREQYGVQAQVILNGRPASYFEPRLPKAPGENFLVLCAAAMEERKGYQYLLQAARQIPNLEMAWAGSGSWEGALRLQAEDFGLSDRIQFLGERSDVCELMNQCDAFALPSQSEGMPLAILEAMAKGLPVVATSVGGIGEAMGDTGRIVADPLRDQAKTVLELTQALADWADDEELRRNVGAAAHARAAVLFREDRMINEYVNLTRKLLV